MGFVDLIKAVWLSEREMRPTHRVSLSTPSTSAVRLKHNWSQHQQWSGRMFGLTLLSAPAGTVQSTSTVCNHWGCNKSGYRYSVTNTSQARDHQPPPPSSHNFSPPGFSFLKEFFKNLCRIKNINGIIKQINFKDNLSQTKLFIRRQYLII